MVQAASSKMLKKEACVQFVRRCMDNSVGGHNSALVLGKFAVTQSQSVCLVTIASGLYIHHSFMYCEA